MTKFGVIFQKIMNLLSLEIAYQTVCTKFSSKFKNQTFIKPFRDHSASSLENVKSYMYQLAQSISPKFGSENFNLNFEINNFLYEFHSKLKFH